MSGYAIFVLLLLIIDVLYVSIIVFYSNDNAIGLKVSYYFKSIWLSSKEFFGFLLPWLLFMGKINGLNKVEGISDGEVVNLSCYLCCFDLYPEKA